MREREQPTIQTMKASEARAQFSQVLNEVFRRQKRVVVEKSGIPVAGIVSAQDLERLQAFEAQRENDFAVLDEIRAAFAGEPAEKIQDEVDRALAEIRAENRAQAQRTASTS